MSTASVEVEKTVIVGNVARTITSSMTRKMYSWSKYGGANYGLVQENKTPEWFCQACKQTQTSELPTYMFEIIDGEFIRICAECQFLKINKQINSLMELIALVRKLDDAY